MFENVVNMIYRKLRNAMLTLRLFYPPSASSIRSLAKTGKDQLRLHQVVYRIGRHVSQLYPSTLASPADRLLVESTVVLQ